MGDSTDTFVKEVYHNYDYVIIDSSSVLAADDTTSWAPKIDATLFIVRLSHASIRVTRKSLELLYNRQVNVPGVILNYLDTSLPEYQRDQYLEVLQYAGSGGGTRNRLLLAPRKRKTAAITPDLLGSRSIAAVDSNFQERAERSGGRRKPKIAETLAIWQRRKRR